MEAELKGCLLNLLAERAAGENLRAAAVIYPSEHGVVVRAAVEGLATLALEHGYELQAVQSSECRGLEFDASIVVQPEDFGPTAPDLALLFVALTRSTQWTAVIAAEPVAGWLRAVFENG